MTQPLVVSEWWVNAFGNPVVYNCIRKIGIGFIWCVRASLLSNSTASSRVISRRRYDENEISVSLVEETGVLGGNHWTDMVCDMTLHIIGATCLTLETEDSRDE